MVNNNINAVFVLYNLSTLWLKEMKTCTIEDNKGNVSMLNDVETLNNSFYSTYYY